MIKKGSFELNTLAHVALGSLGALEPRIVLVWVCYVIIYEGTLRVYRSRLPFFQATRAAAYMSAMELIVRMSDVGLPHELTKYAVILILINGFLAGHQWNRQANSFILYLILLLPSILMIESQSLEQARQMISFNLSGPICLGVSAIHFNKYPLSVDQLLQLFKRFLLPIAATIAWLFISTPSISEISFGFGANSKASGYGPNQMAALFGFGILILTYCKLNKWQLFTNGVWANGFLLILFYRALLTFSRGGILGTLITIVAILFVLKGTNNKKQKRYRNIGFSSGIIILIIISAFSYVNRRTNGELFNRYAGISKDKAVNLQKYTSGRTDIIKIDLSIFSDYPIFGCGPGMANDLREVYGYGQRVAAHVEYSRLLAEHGLFGIIALYILISTPIKRYFSTKMPLPRSFILFGVLYCLTFMSHSATRIAIPMFIYGLSFVKLHGEPR